MEPIDKQLASIKDSLESVQQPSEELTLARAYTAQLKDCEIDQLERLMAEVQARYPNADLPVGTPDMYLAEWADMVAKYTMKPFVDAFSRVMRDRARPEYFPTPGLIEAECMAASRSKRDREEADKAVKEVDEWKAQWERERAEDIAAENLRDAPPKDPVKQLLNELRPQRSPLQGWTPDELRVAADAMERAERRQAKRTVSESDYAARSNAA